MKWINRIRIKNIFPIWEVSEARGHRLKVRGWRSRGYLRALPLTHSSWNHECAVGGAAGNYI